MISRKKKLFLVWMALFGFSVISNAIEPVVIRGRQLLFEKSSK
jgi:hypothetical protein